MDTFLPNLLMILMQIFTIGYNVLKFIALIIVILCGVKYLRDN